MMRKQVWPVAAAGLILLMSLGVAVAATPMQVAFSGPVAVQSDSGMTVIIEGSGDLSGDTLFPSSETVAINSTVGNITLSASGTSSVRVVSATGAETVLTGFDDDGVRVTATPGDKSSFSVAGAIQEVRWDGSATVGDGSTDVVVTTDPGGELSAHGGTVTVPVASTTTSRVLAVDANGDVVGGGPIVNNRATIRFADAGSHDVELRQDNAPDVFGPEPAGNTTATQPTFTVNVSDPDFADGDTVDVVFYLDGQKQSTTTVSSDGTVSFAPNVQFFAGTEHSWRVEVEDRAGATDSTGTISFKVPEILTFRNVSNASEVVDNVSVTVEFRSSETVVSRNTSTGRLNMTGLPASEPFTLQVEAANFTARTVPLKSLFAQQDVYLIPETKDTVEVLFVLDDKTGTFVDDGTRLFIQRAITRNGSTSFVTVSGGQPGATGAIETTLQRGETYRLVVENSDGDRRALGEYEAITDARETLPITNVEFGGDAAQSDALQLSATRQTGDNPSIGVTFFAPRENITEVRLLIHRPGNLSNTLRPETVDRGEFGIFSEQVALGPNQTDGEWIVRLKAISPTGTVTLRQTVGQQLALPVGGVSGGLLSLLGWGSWLMVTGLVVLIDGKLGGLISTVWMAGLVYFEIISSVTFPLLGLALVISVLAVTGRATP